MEKRRQGRDRCANRKKRQASEEGKTERGTSKARPASVVWHDESTPRGESAHYLSRAKGESRSAGSPSPIPLTLYYYPKTLLPEKKILLSDSKHRQEAVKQR